MQPARTPISFLEIKENGKDYYNFSTNIACSDKPGTMKLKFHVYKPEGWSWIGYYFHKYFNLCSKWTEYKSDDTTHPFTAVLIKKNNLYDADLITHLIYNHKKLDENNGVPPNTSKQEQLSHKTNPKSVTNTIETPLETRRKELEKVVDASRQRLTKAKRKENSQIEIVGDAYELETKKSAARRLERENNNEAEQVYKEKAENEKARAKIKTALEEKENMLETDIEALRKEEERLNAQIAALEAAAEKDKESSTSSSVESPELAFPGLPDNCATKLGESGLSAFWPIEASPFEANFHLFSEAQLMIESSFSNFYRASSTVEITLMSENQTFLKILESLNQMAALQEGDKLYFNPNGSLEIDTSNAATRAIAATITTVIAAQEGKIDQAYDIKNLAFFIDFLARYTDIEPIPYDQAVQLVKLVKKTRKGIKNLQKTYAPHHSKEENIQIVNITRNNLKVIYKKLDKMIRDYDHANFEQLSDAALLYLSELKNLTKLQMINETGKLVASWGKIQEPKGERDLKDIEATIGDTFSFMDEFSAALSRLPLPLQLKQYMLAESIFHETQCKMALKLTPEKTDSIELERQARVKQTKELFGEINASLKKNGLDTPKKTAIVTLIRNSKLFDFATTLYETPTTKTDIPHVEGNYLRRGAWFACGALVDGFALYAGTPLITLAGRKLADIAYKNAGVDMKELAALTDDVNAKGKEATEQTNMMQKAYTNIVNFIAPSATKPKDKE